MLKQFFKTAVVIATAVFLSQNSYASSEQNECILSFARLQDAYAKSNFEATVIDSIATSMLPYSLIHVTDNGYQYTTWKSLNGEITGYALRDLKGFDFNHNQNFAGALTWHQSSIWDRLFDDKTKLRGYECTLMGKTRLAGRKVSVMKLSPIDDVRYSFIVSKDDDTNLPVELAVVAPSQMIVAKFTVTAMHQASTENVSFPNEAFDGIENLNPKRAISEEQWKELVIPPNFSLEYTGTQQFTEDKKLSFQAFSDGIVEFRVYRDTPTSVSIPQASDGSLTVYRVDTAEYEYAVVGEIPLDLSALVLSKLKRR